MSNLEVLSINGQDFFIDGFRQELIAVDDPKKHIDFMDYCRGDCGNCILASKCYP